jgi:hypothetical protein
MKDRGTYNESKSWELDPDEKRLGLEWLGYGSLDAPFWFIGLEPGGNYDPLFARFWIDSLRAAPVFDPRRDARVCPNKWFIEGKAASQSTWNALIETVLGFTGSTDGVLDYQLNHFGRLPPEGEMAILELSAFAAPGTKSYSPHRFTFVQERVEAIRQAIRFHHPQFVVCYGTTQRQYFSEIVCGFDQDGIKWVGPTLCMLVDHPSAWGVHRDWRKLGVELKERLRARSAGTD